jgi:hypothetical protein
VEAGEGFGFSDQVVVQGDCGAQGDLQEGIFLSNDDGINA